MEKVYIAIDLKSFYASVECADRKYDPLSTNLIVADLSRTEKTICLAVSPSLKKYGISGRARLFEVVQRVKEINQDRFRKAIKHGVLPKDEKGHYHFTSSSFDAEALDSDPALELGYIVATPRMMLYEKISTQVFSVYSKYIAPEDIHVYSIDEVFIDATPYLATYAVSAHELAMQMIREVLYTTGITATAGIGTNMYLAKVAMDIVAKHVPADEQGVRIAELDEMGYREKLWCHTPITDFWRVGPGTARRLERLGCYTMGDVARLSVHDEGALYKAMGINAELLIDHAWGWEPTDIATIKSYRSETTSLSSGQVLKEPYDYDKGRLIVCEMTELLVIDLVRKAIVTKQIVLTISYDKESLEERGRTYYVKKTGKPYTGKVVADFYGRPHPSHAHGTGNIDHYTSSTTAIMETMMEIFDRIVDPDLLIRRVNIAACNLIPETEIPEEGPEQMSLFVDYEAVDKAKRERKEAEEKERKLQRAELYIQDRFEKNAILKGMNFFEGGTTRERNEQIGGHRAGSDEMAPKKQRKKQDTLPKGGDVNE